jgi:uncharacterized cupredoxin-like copper-binding protein
MKLAKLAMAALAVAVIASPAIGKTTVKKQAMAGPTVINVTLWDKNMANVDMSKGMGLGVGMGGDMSKAPMGISINKKQVKAGTVTFAVLNSSKDTVHEVIVSVIAGPNETMPYLTDQNRVDEEHGSHLGEVAELEPGKTGALTVTLKPGTYLLYCNIPQHYMDGMWTMLEVTK